MQYWKNIYQNENIPKVPSNFAIFIGDTLGSKIKTIVDLGCGNGRDAYYLQKYARVVGVDHASKPKDSYNASFIQSGMENMKGYYDLIYMRFSLHSVDEDVEQRVLDYAKYNCKYLAIEARSTNDTLCSGDKYNSVETTYAQAHYRRYIDINILKDQLISRGFTIKHISESDKYACYQGTTPTCLRVIASL